MRELPKAYLPKDYETDVYRRWEESGFFNPDNLPGQRNEPYSIALPPPNATGILHVGHSVMLALQDLLIRFNRMRGKRTLWVPGTDHAAIATQNVVEKKLYKEEGKRRFDYGRDEFVRRVAEFAENSRATIRGQMRSMGVSCDWSRERYTLDAGLSAAVKEAFVRMYQDSLIYRGKRIVNWCYRCGTTLSDDEVEYREQKTKFYYLKYGPITIGTARPETKVLDKVIIVHPEDARYQQYVGKEFDVPWIDGTVRAKVVADPVAEMETGTGAMTITPAHSFVDYELARKYGFEVVEIIGPDGKLTQNAGKFAGLKVAAAREKIVEELAAKGLVDHIDEDYVNNLSVCYRCGTPVEPMPSEQWFVAVDKPFRQGWFRRTTLKQLALKAVTSGGITIVPERFVKTYQHWINNLHDWCISRQIWFGHRIPAWRCATCRKWHVTAQEPTKLTIYRHGPTSWSTAGDQLKVQGSTDVPLAEDEVAQVEAAAATVQKPDVIISSPMMRARQTAEVFRQALGSVPIVVDERLQERNYGEFENKRVADIKRDYPEYYKDKLTYPVPGAETYAEIEARLRSWLEDVVKKYAGKKVTVVAHNAVMRTLRKALEGLDDATLTNYLPKISEPLTYQLVGSCPHCKSWSLSQDEDTLDTWFSSGLWTFSTLGWPEKTRELATFHPTNVLETSYDILFFWVARMVLMTTYLLEQVPFHTVYLHGLVRDKQGRKMSKSAGNGIDPLEMIEKYGADALRLAMIIGTTPGNDFQLYEEKIAGYRNFVNKLWNIVRYVNLSVGELVLREELPRATTLADRWILSRFGSVARLVTKKITTFQFSEAGEALYDFTWHELADWYLEIAKLEGGKDEILSYLLTNLLKLWHPYTPFVTETLWQETFGESAGLLMVAKWPKQLPTYDETAEKEFKLVQDVVTALRTYRTEHKLEPGQEISMALREPNVVLEQNRVLLEGLRTKTRVVTALPQVYS